MKPEHLRMYVDRLRRLHDATRNGQPAVLPAGAISRLDHIERRLLEAVRRDETGSPEHDGYPTGSIGNGGEDAAQSSTEAAALARLGIAIHDRHHELTALAVEHLRQAVDHITSLLGTLEAVDRLKEIPRRDPGGTCQACHRHVHGTPIDRIVAGWCPDCRNAWNAYVIASVTTGQTPDRHAFARQQRQAS